MNSSAVTCWLDNWREGDPDALPLVMSELYAQLRRAAADCFRREFRVHTLQPTALVHEAYAHLAGGQPVPCNNRNHFIGIARRLMGQILQQYARRRKASKRGGQNERVPLEDNRVLGPQPTSAAEALEEALERLRRFKPRRFLIIEMRYQFGSSVHEIAAATRLSVRTVERELTLGRAWLEQAVFGETCPWNRRSA